MRSSSRGRWCLVRAVALLAALLFPAWLGAIILAIFNGWIAVQDWLLGVPLLLILVGIFAWLGHGVYGVVVERLDGDQI